ncbi:ribosome maturation factor RimM [Fervidibacillus halotolerans]|uniref:Ribosome maturation factor RimM n=1 Tax=Fervidibacillus halotolerans TaxID=2980027 RepID=A0A9E8RZR0_9BACI|nr:ribosome maturation factor RimM [Fervidibacillus halotolerans]WAA13623.1 ribosome maturation factor RimM [Fervidibacillus halotolerans]
MEKYYKVGKIVNTHGIRGEVRVISVTDFPEQRYKKGSKLYLFLTPEKPPIELEVNSWRKHKNFDLLTFTGYHSINDVEPLKGGILKVSEKELSPLSDGEYYFHEIIGCKVMTTDNQHMGVITNILTPGANDVWVVKGEDGKEYYIPYIGEVVKEINVEDQVVRIEPMEGLFN